MVNHEVEKLREGLQALRLQLGEELRAGLEAGATVQLDQSRVGRLSRMDAMQAQAMSQEVSRRLQTRLRQIESALARLQAGEYGYCNECGELIDPRRLEIDLLATRCISCASKNEF
ncbi:MAG: TraR/DksA C4-type zinc finger protein [Gammaproteobacteria bacterium]|nr:TraR/DksA C4-type zinc finger protein [Gammaproteobacteria bacterium]